MKKIIYVSAFTLPIIMAGSMTVMAAEEEVQVEEDVVEDQPVLQDSDNSYDGFVTVTQDTSSEGLELTARTDSNPYDGNPLEGGYMVKIAEGTLIEYSIDGGITWNEDVPSITNVGTLNYKVRATNPWYDTVIADGVLEITKRSVTITVNDASKTYGEDDPTFTGSLTNNFLVNEDDLGTISFRRTNDDEEVDIYKDVLTATYTQNDNYEVKVVNGDFTIHKRKYSDRDDPEEEEEHKFYADGGEKTYDGKELKGTICAPEGTSFAYSYSDDGGTIWIDSDTELGIKNVGTRLVKVVATNPNYEDATCEYTLEVTPRPVTVTANDKSKIYGESDPTFDAEVSGTIDGDTIDFSFSREKGEEVGEYEITPTGETLKGNYKVTYLQGILTITKSDKLSVEGDDYLDVYDGSVHGVAASPNIAEGTTIYYSVDNGEYTTVVPTIKDVGIHHVTVRATNPNYEDATTTYTLEVTPANVIVKVNDVQKYVGEADPEFTTSISGLVAGESESLITYSLSRASGETVGDYEISANGESIQGNYSVTYESGTLTILSKEQERTGNVIVHYVDRNGNTIQESVSVLDDVIVGTEYDVSSYKLSSIIVDGKTYVLKEVIGNETGSVLEGTNEVTFVYELEQETEPDDEPNDTPKDEPKNGIKEETKVSNQTNAKSGVETSVSTNALFFSSIAFVSAIGTIFTRKKIKN